MPSADILIAALLTGLGLGWVAIPHCFGMCGALHLTVSAVHSERPMRSLLLFNLGRLLGYTLLGALAGGAGFLMNGGRPACHACAGSAGRLYLSRLVPAIFFLLLALGAWRKQDTGGWMPRFFTKVFGSLGLLGGGCATSLLPCGVLYAALATAVGTGSCAAGALLMFMFCLTTSVCMQLVIVAGHGVHHTYRTVVGRTLPFIFLVLAAWYFWQFFR